MLAFYTEEKEKKIALIKDHFIPVTLDGYLCGNGAEIAFLDACSSQTNGFTYVTAGGKVLGGNGFVDRLWGLEAALEEFKKLPEAERKPRVEKPQDAGSLEAVPRPPPPGGLIANVYFNYLERDAKGEWTHALWHVGGWPGTTPGSAYGQNQYASQIDKFWLTETEWKSLLPANPTKGKKFPLPAPIQRRIVRFYANDIAHRIREEGIRGAELTLTVEEVSADGVRLRLEGTTQTGLTFEKAPLNGTSGEEGGVCGADFGWLGTLHYSAKKKAFDRFDIVALGEGWGGNSKSASTTNFYRGGEHRRWPMGIVFELVSGDRPVDRIPPQNANPYRCSDYFADR